jgi:hypothetical protein
MDCQEEIDYRLFAVQLIRLRYAHVSKITLGDEMENLLKMLVAAEVNKLVREYQSQGDRQEVPVLIRKAYDELMAVNKAVQEMERQRRQANIDEALSHPIRL